MSRTIISAVVAVVIAALTAIAFFGSNFGASKETFTKADNNTTRAYQVAQRLAQLQGIEVSNKAERLASRKEFVRALQASGSERVNQARLGFQKFAAEENPGARPGKSDTGRPDIIALVDANGEVLAMHEVQSLPPGSDKMWLNQSKDVKNLTMKPTRMPALNVVLAKRMIISDIWNDEGKVMKVGVAPIIDPDNINPKDPEGVSIIGAIVVGYAQTAKNAQGDAELLGSHIAYYDEKDPKAYKPPKTTEKKPCEEDSVCGTDMVCADAACEPKPTEKRVAASSFLRGSDEDTAKANELRDLLSNGTLRDKKKNVFIDGIEYRAATVKLPRSATKPLPDDYPPVTAGAVVLVPLEKADTSSTKLFVLLLGAGALAMAILGIYLAHRRLVGQADQIEQGVTDIINGNLDRTFRPVGPELDGLANGLNVMLARLLGRPEPGEEEFDEEGNPIIPGRVEFEETEEGTRPQPDPDLAALAQESEPDYYKRVYTEYLAARKASGAPDEVSFENFIAKLKVNEGKLKAQYNCRAVRFRVVTKDGKVSLKPVPIYA